MPIWSAEIKELERLYESFKGQLPDLEKELERLIKADDENMILLYSRRCLEVIITDLCECELKRDRGTEPLKGIIDKLNKERKVPSHIVTSMQGLNELSTYGAHPKDFDPEQVKPVLVNLNIIIKWYLKYKETRAQVKAAVAEEIRQEAKGPEITKKSTLITKKRLIGLVSGLILFVVILIAVLFFTNIIGDSKLEKSIAVLPFDNLSNEPEQEYFSDGIVESILNHLFKVGELKVKSSPLTKRFKNTELSLKKIARELGVSYILVGSVQKIGNNVRITTQLINARNNEQLWSEIYNRDLSDILSIETEVAQNIARGLKATLTYEEEEQIEKSETQNPEAHLLYLRGRFFWNKRTKEGLIKSIDYFEKAIALDQDYALAIAGLADAYSIQSFWGWSPAEEGYSKAKELAERAIKIDNRLSEAHATLGNILCYGEWKWEEARKKLLHAIELNPNCANAHQYYSELLDIIGQNDEARMHINLALKLDPYNLLMHNISAQNYYHEGKLNKCVEECFAMQELDPNYLLTYLWSFNTYIRQRDDINAIKALQQIMLLDTLTAKQANIVQDVYDKSGIKGLIDWVIELKYKMNAHIFYVADSTFYLARYFAMLGRKEEAMDLLEKGIGNRSMIPKINNDPDFDILRSEPRFQKLIEKMGLSDYQKPN